MNYESKLSRRERQIVNAIYATGEATASEVLERIDDPPSRTAVRTLLSILVEKEVLTYTKRGREYVYKPRQQKDKAGRSALRNLLETFFGGSVEEALASHLADPKIKLDKDKLKRLEEVIRNAKRGGKKQ